jgi:hypothetical protein
VQAVRSIESVLTFPSPSALAERMREAGFPEVSYKTLFGGICALHVGMKATGLPSGTVATQQLHAEDAG